MKGFALSFEWTRPVDGVEVVDLGDAPERDPRQKVVKLGTPYGRHFQPRSDRIAPVLLDAVDLEDPLILRFINAHSEEKLAAYIGRYGFLGTDHEVAVSEVEKSRARISELVDLALNNPLKASAAALSDLMKNSAATLDYDLGGPGGAGRLVLKPKGPLTFMRVEVAIAAMSGVRLKRCEQCGSAFFYGANTGRRSHAKYCSEKCRAAAMRRRNAEAAHAD